MRETLKFHYESSGTTLSPFAGFEELNAARQEVRQLGLLGMDENGAGFGNLSLRDGSSFYITGTGSGVQPFLTLQDYAQVTTWDFERNWLHCEGQAIASAESLTHAAVYESDAKVGAVVHGHDPSLWRELQETGLATAGDVPYGTPEVAREVERLFRETDLRASKIFAMAGHTDGLVAFGDDLREVLALLRRMKNREGRQRARVPHTR